MKRVVIILLSLIMMVSLCLIVNAAPLLPGVDKIITPTLPVVPTLNDPVIEPDTFEAPSELKALEVKYNTVSLQWKENSNTETGFILERKTSSSNYTQLAVLTKDITTHMDNTVEASTTYYYRVKAVLKNGQWANLSTDYSNELKVITPAAATLPFIRPNLGIKLPGTLILPPVEDTVEPTPGTTPAEVKAPEELFATVMNGKDISLKWADKSDNEEGFLVYRASTGDWEEAAVLEDNEEEYVDEVLEPNTTYYYVVFAYKGNIASLQSNVVEIKTPEVAPTPAAQPKEIAAPQGLSATAQNSTEILLVWEDKSKNEEGFLLYRTVSGDWELAAKLNSSATSYLDNTAKANTKYYYVLYAYVGEAVSKESNIAEVATSGETTSPAQTIAPAAVDYTGASSWALAELAKSVEYGLYTESIMKNYSQNITREEFCELAIKLYEKLKAAETAPVTPNPFRDTANESILKAFGAGIVKGTGEDTFSPNNSITRQDICVMLYRAITGAVPNVDESITGVPVFTDENLIGPWAIKEVRFAYKNSIMKGVGANKIGPRDNTSREQALILIKRVYEAFKK